MNTERDAFWPRFTVAHWNRWPTVFKDAPGLPLATPTEVFDALREATDRFRAGDSEILIRLITEEQFTLEPKAAGPYLPGAEDRCAEEYVERITRKLHGVRFALILNRFPFFEESVWRRVREFVGGLAQEIPAHKSSFALFLGNYGQTPFRIHRDAASVFHFVIEGRKRMYTWPGDYFPPGAVKQVTPDFEELKQALDGPAYERALAESVLLEGESGDVLFWPPSFWHVGECVDGMSMTLSLGLEPVRPEMEVRHRLLGHLVEAEGDTPSETTLQGLVNSNGFIRHAASRTATAARGISRDPEFENALRESWLNRQTACGHTPVPPALPWQRLEDEVPVQVDPAYPIAWTPIAEQEMVCSAGGRSFRIPADPQVERLLTRLNTGQPEAVGALIREHTGTTERDGVRFVASEEGLRILLSRLHTLRAFREAER